MHIGAKITLNLKETQRRKMQAIYKCCRPKRHHAVICAILWTICVSLTLIGTVMMTMETKYGSDLLKQDCLEVSYKRKHVQNTTSYAHNEGLLCGNMEKAIYLASSMYLLSDALAENLLGAFFALYSVIKSKPLFGVPFLFTGLSTGLSGIMALYMKSGFEKEFKMFSNERLFYWVCSTVAMAIVVGSIWSTLAIYCLAELKKLQKDAEKLATIKHMSCGGLTHTVKAKPLLKKVTLTGEKK